MLRLSLEYPNGRTHELDYAGPARLHPGDEFNLYGRRWRVEGRRRQATTGAPAVVVCSSLTERGQTIRDR